MKELNFNDLKLLLGKSIEEINTAINDGNILTINGVSIFNVFKHKISTFDNNHPVVYLDLYNENERIACVPIFQNKTLYIKMDDDIEIR